MTLEIERESLRNETDVFSVERRTKVEETLKQKQEEASRLTEIWQAERARLERIKDIKRGLKNWEGWRLDLVDVRRGGAGQLAAGEVFEV